MITRFFLVSSNFARNALTLMTGTIIAQSVPILASPLLTRIYSPDAFGLFGTFLAISSILSVMVTGRYELAILLPRKRTDAMTVMALSIVLSVVVSIALLFVFVALHRKIGGMLRIQSGAEWLIAVPLAAMLTGVYQSLNYWNNREKQYKRMASNRVIQSSTAALTQLILGVRSIAGGLITGQMLGIFISNWVLGRAIWKSYQDNRRSVSWVRLLALAKKYSAFPKYLIAAHGCNLASSQLPTVLIGAIFNSATAGFYVLTQRVISMPITVVAGAVGDVFRQEASELYARDKQCLRSYLSALKKLIYLSSIPFLAFFFIAPYCFEAIFGKNWRAAGEYAQLLTPMFFLRFVTSPLSVMFVIAQRQRLDLLWQVCLLILVLSVFFLASAANSIGLALTGLSSVYSFMYIINGFLSYKLAKGQLLRRNEQKN